MDGGIANQGRNTNAVDVLTQVGCLPRAIHRGVIILSVVDWCAEVDSGIGQDRHLLGSVHDVVSSGTAKGRSLGPGLPNLHIFEEVPQHEAHLRSE